MSPPTEIEGLEQAERQAFIALRDRVLEDPVLRAMWDRWRQAHAALVNARLELARTEREP